ncbi:hypothetical protein AXG89_40335 [Burkholderia sp. PAMC 26561]|nr:hypothetical protein AXG89_40335 [Burkholderia sp. PAMC 26561]
MRNLSSIDQTLKTVKYAYETKGGTAMDELQAKGLLPPSIVFRVSVAGLTEACLQRPGRMGPRMSRRTRASRHCVRRSMHRCPA